MSLYRDTSRAFDQKLRLVDAAVGLPAEVVDLRTRLAQVQGATGRPMLDALVTSVVDGTGDTGALWAAALAEATSTPASHNELLSAVRARIHDRIRHAYAGHADSTYSKVAAKFDAAATALTACREAVDIEAPAEAVLTLPDKARKAWREAATHAADLTALIPALRAAATLAGICDDHPDSELALTVDPGDVDRRLVWRCWDTEKTEQVADRQARNHLPFTDTPLPTRSRCGRWGALVAAGCVLRACPPEHFTDYRRPGPMVETVTNTPGGPVRAMVDADHYQPPERRRITSPRIRVT